MFQLAVLCQHIFKALKKKTRFEWWSHHTWSYIHCIADHWARKLLGLGPSQTQQNI